jgi:hypothetical protein
MKIEQIIECLWAFQEMKAKKKAHQERMEAQVDANLEWMKTCLGKMEAKIEASQESREADIKTLLEEMNARESEANQGNIEAIPDHQEFPNEEAAVESIGALED